MAGKLNSLVVKWLIKTLNNGGKLPSPPVSPLGDVAPGTPAPGKHAILPVNHATLPITRAIIPAKHAMPMITKAPPPLSVALSRRRGDGAGGAGGAVLHSCHLPPRLVGGAPHPRPPHQDPLPPQHGGAARRRSAMGARPHISPPARGARGSISS
eukprot:93714-Prorocentrum_minimum.AAC.1